MTESSGLEFGPARHGGEALPSSGASYLLFAHELDSWDRSSEGIDQAYNRSWGQLDQQKKRASPAARSLDAVHNGDSSLFSSSLPALFKNQLTMDGPTRETSVDDDLFGSLEEMESQTIGNLLPDDEEELFAGIRDQVLAETAEESEDLDLFSSGGGLELDADGQPPPEFFQQGFNHPPTAGEHPFGEHPSRTLFVRNINSNVEDTELRALFEKYGDIRTLYTACKHRGFVMISYYDIRSARLALRSLQGKPLRRRKLDIHFSIPKDNPSDKDMNQGTLVVFNLDASVSNDDLLQIFGAYGEIKEIRETPHKRHHKFIEFFDVRAAEAALRGLNRTDIAGKRIKLEPSRPGGARKSLMQQHGRELDPEDSFHPRTAWTNSPPGPSCDLRGALEADSSFLSPNSTMYRPYSPRVSGQLHDLSRGGFAEGQSRPLRSHVLDQPGGPHPHSLPDFSLLGKGQPYKAAVTSFSRPIDGLETRGIARATSLKEGSFPHLNGGELLHTQLGGTALQRSASLSGQPGLWGTGPYSQGSKMLWQNMSPGQTYGDSLFSSGFSQLGSYSRELSADRHHSYAGDTQELPAYVQSASFGSLRVNGLNGGHMDHGSPSPNFGMYLQHRMLPNGGSSFDERRNRRADNGLFAQAESKKQFQLDIDRIISGDDTRTTLMIKNIPNKYTSKMLLAAIDEYHQGTYDFVYLPIDFKNKCNVGYAFINMLSPSLVIPFYQTFNGKKWEKFNSEKVASLAYARIQGKPALIAHFQNSSLMNEDKRCRPIIFHADGPNAGDQEPFPAATDLSRPRLGRFADGSEDYANGAVDAA